MNAITLPIGGEFICYLVALSLYLTLHLCPKLISNFDTDPSYIIVVLGTLDAFLTVAPRPTDLLKIPVLCKTGFTNYDLIKEIHNKHKILKKHQNPALLKAWKSFIAPMATLLL